MRSLKITLLLLLVSFAAQAQETNLEWVNSMGGTATDQGNAIVVDAFGNVYTTGSFRGTVDFDPGPGVFNLTTNGEDVFISKLDASGVFLWAKNMGGTGTISGNAITVDAFGNVYTTGNFTGTADFDPGLGIFNLTASTGAIFVSKLDASGAFLWAKNMGGISDYATPIAVDANGNAYTTGSLLGTGDFDPGPGIFDLTAVGNFDVFISKLDASGAFLWAKNLGGMGTDRGTSITVDARGNVYTTGLFTGAGDFDPGPGVFILTPIFSGNSNIFISKLDASGAFLWAKSIGGASNEQGSSIAVDVSGNVYTTGHFSGTADFDPGSGIVNLTSAGIYDIFILKLSQKNVTGRVYQDFNQNCDQDTFDVTSASIQIQPQTASPLILVRSWTQIYRCLPWQVAVKTRFIASPPQTKPTSTYPTTLPGCIWWS